MLPSFGCQAPACLTLILRLTERIAHRRKKFLVIERLHEKGDRANGHGGSARCQIFSRGDDNNARPRRDRAHSGEDFETGHTFHPNVSHHHGHGMRGGMGQEFFRLIKRSHLPSDASKYSIERRTDRSSSTRQTSLDSAALLMQPGFVDPCARRADGRRSERRDRARSLR
jgi:hypothetical protein